MTGAVERDAASAVVLRGGDVLLVERGKGAPAGLWSLPGGHVEPGETAYRAALREVREETGLAVAILGYLGAHEVVTTGGRRAGVRYRISVFFALADEGAAPQAGGDARQARFVPTSELAGYTLTEGAAALIARAARLTRGCRS